MTRNSECSRMCSTSGGL